MSSLKPGIKLIDFTDADVLAIAKMVMETKCGYCMDGTDLDTPTCPECGTANAEKELNDV